MSRLSAAGVARAALVFGALALFPFAFPAHWVVNLAIFTVMYAGLASSWNLLGGFSGYLSLGHAAFFGIGAYAIGILFTHIGRGGRVQAVPRPARASGWRSRCSRCRSAGSRCACVRRPSRSSPSRCSSSSSSWPSTCTA